MEFVMGSFPSYFNVEAIVFFSLQLIVCVVSSFAYDYHVSRSLSMRMSVYNVWIYP